MGIMRDVAVAVTVAVTVGVTVTEAKAVSVSVPVSVPVSVHVSVPVSVPVSDLSVAPEFAEQQRLERGQREEAHAQRCPSAHHAHHPLALAAAVQGRAVQGRGRGEQVQTGHLVLQACRGHLLQLPPFEKMTKK